MNEPLLQQLVCLGSASKIEKELIRLGYCDAKNDPAAKKVSLVTILRHPSKIKTEWVRKWLHEVQLYATTEPVEGYLFVCLQENELQPLKGRSIPADVRIYCKLL
ncbi:MAG: hypothetical protein IJY89_04420 [Clostridia bacterium]|nr:hypothetical protein [Clostridia bacterium]MBQ8911794.1 hypothetical protein [Clostridia bacterium]